VVYPPREIPVSSPVREPRFVQENAERWRQLEAALEARAPADPDRLAALYVRATDDLAYAQTYFPGSDTERYLNALAARVHHRLYGSGREERRRLVTFWAREVPQAVHAARRPMALSAAVFAAAMAVGVLSATGDEAFVRLILGDAYVNMTLANIEAGDPMAVYKQERALDMALGITLNNVLVAFRAFAMGLLAGVGTLFVLAFNGIMLGAFGHFFWAEGLLAVAMRTVWIHGTLEIAAIVVAGGAGLELARGLLFPGTYPRGHAFAEGARRGAKIVVGLTPVFVVAGFVEGYVTRYTEMPLAAALAIILGSLSFALWYFVLYPRRVARSAPPSVPSPHAPR